MHLPFTPNHVQLISACYPPNAALLTAGPDYRPNSQELSRMTYYASNRPGKINKLASELEKRIRLDSRKAKAGNIRARSYVLFFPPSTGANVSSPDPSSLRLLLLKPSRQSVAGTFHY